MSITWLNEYRATPGFLLASSAICCRFVYRFAGFSVPSRVSRQQFSSMTSPFSPAGPIDLVPRLRRYYGDATPSWIANRSLMISPPGSRASLAFVLSLTRSRRTGENPFGPGAFRCRIPPFRPFHADNTGLLRFPADPFHTSAVFQDPGRIETSSPKWTRRYCPRTQQSEGSSMTMISRPIPRLQHPLSTLHEQHRRCPCKTRFRLAG
jgi:hypothetical protein